MESFVQVMRLSNANARSLTWHSTAVAVRVAGLGIMLMLYSVTVLGIRLAVCEKRLRKMEDELAERDAQ